MKPTIALFALSVSLQAAVISNIRIQPSSLGFIVGFRLSADLIDTACTVDVTRTFTGGSPDFSANIAPLDTTRFPNAHTVAAGSAYREIAVGGGGLVKSSVDSWVMPNVAEQDAPHGIKITCGAANTTVVARTRPRPLGSTWAPRLYPDPANPGLHLWQTWDWGNTAFQTWDPNTGALIKPMGGPGFVSTGTGPSGTVLYGNPIGFGTVTGGSGSWTNVNAIKVDDVDVAGAGSAVYNGTDRAKLYLNAGIDLSGVSFLDMIIIENIKACTEGASKTWNVCLTGDRSTCDSDVRTFTTTNIGVGGSCNPTGVSVPATLTANWDMWRSADQAQLSYSAWDTDNSGTGVGINTDRGFLIWAGDSSAQKTLFGYANHRYKYSQGSNVGGSGGFIETFSQVRDSLGCYKGYAGGNGGTSQQLWCLFPDTGEARYLGAIATGQNAGDGHNWSKTDPDVYYAGNSSLFALAYTPAGGIGGGHYDEAKPMGGDTAGVASTTPLTLTTAICTSMQTWWGTYGDPAIPWPAGTNCAVQSAAGSPTLGDYVVVQALTGEQDSYCWFGVFYVDALQPEGTGTTGMKGVWPVYASPASRWGVCHGMYSGPEKSIFAGINFPKTGNASGGRPYGWTILDNVASCTLPCTTQMRVISSNDGTGGNPANGEPFSIDQGTGVNAVNYLQASKVGDWVSTNKGELMKIVSKDLFTAPGTWTITFQRGCIGGAQTYTGGPLNTADYMTMYPAPADVTCAAGQPFLPRPVWKFMDDTTGRYATNLVLGDTSHDYFLGRYGNGGGGTIIDCPGSTDVLYDCTTAVGTAQMIQSNFSGAGGYTEGNSVEKHPSHANRKAVTEYDRSQSVDVYPILGGGWNVNGVNPTVTLVGGTSHVYEITDFSGHPLSPKKVLPIVLSGDRILRDASGPSSAISDAAGSDYTYCIVVRTNECRTGATAGKVFVSVPGGMTNLYCSGGEFSVGTSDLCALNAGMQVHNVMMAGLIKNSEGTAGEIPLGAGAIGLGYTRALTSQLTAYRALPATTNAKTDPEGKWMFTTLWRGIRNDGTLTKIPPMPAKDSTPRDTFVPITVKLNAPAGTNNAVIEYGYDSRLFCDGQDANGTWDGRSEICVRAAQASMDHDYAGDSVTGVSCTASCTITIPAISQHPGWLHWRARFRDASNNTLFVGQIQRVAVH